MNENSSLIKESIYVNNAGIVLLYPYITTLFERLNLTKDEQFISEEKQLKAPHYLQYLISGFSETDEIFLAFNKALCGLDLETTLSSGIDITPEEETLLNGLLEVAIRNWPALSSTSVANFRGSFLLREGKLTMQESEWSLDVRANSFDILLDQLPYSYTNIKFPWMEKMVVVNWR